MKSKTSVKKGTSLTLAISHAKTCARRVDVSIIQCREPVAGRLKIAVSAVKIPGRFVPLPVVD